MTNKVYPVKSIEYGTYDWLLREVGGFLDKGYDRNLWKHPIAGKIDSIVQSGYMQFCFPPPLMRIERREEGDTTDITKEEIRKSPHQWSFMSPLQSLELKQDTDTYDLPDDFASVIGDFTSGNNRVPVVSEVHLRQLIAVKPAGGKVQYAAIRPKRPNGWEVIFYPKPGEGDTGTLNYRYTIAPPALSDDNPVPLGGREHADTILQSCLAVAEEREGKTAGIASQRFMERLSASIHLDKQAARVSEDHTWDVSADGKNTIRELVGLHMGYGPNESTWTEAQLQKVKEAVRQGKRKFIVPPILPGERYSYEWSFLHPVSILTLQDSVYEYDLPEDFAGLDSPLTYAAGTSVIYPDIQVIGEHHIRQKLQLTTASTRPQFAAVRVKQGVDEGPTRYEMLLWPVPDESYEIHYRYRISPDNDEVMPGGPDHFQTILESCLACADAMNGVKNSPHEKRFLERVSASISYDRQLASPETMGYDRDRSDRTEYGGIRKSYHDIDINIVTYNGNEY